MHKLDANHIPDEIPVVSITYTRTSELIEPKVLYVYYKRARLLLIKTIQLCVMNWRACNTNMGLV